MLRFDAEGLQRTEIAERLDIGVASVYRVLADARRALVIVGWWRFDLSMVREAIGRPSVETKVEELIR